MREGKEEVNTNVCGWFGIEQVRTHRQTQTCTYSYTAPDREVSEATLVFKPPPGGRSSTPWWAEPRWVSTGPSLTLSSGTKDPRLLPHSLPSLLFQFMSLKQNRTEAQKK